MPKQKDCIPRTYGMQYKDFSKILSQKMQEVKDCKGYKEFVEDVALLRKTRKNCGKPSILANYGMKVLCNMSKTEIRKYVDSYKKGMLDPYQYEPKERDREKETGLMEDNDDSFGTFFIAGKIL